MYLIDKERKTNSMNIETPKPLAFIAEQFAGGAWAKLADIVLHETVEASPPVVPETVE